MTIATSENATASIKIYNLESQEIYECHVRIRSEASGGFSAEIVSLPGVASQGDTAVEALENLKEAFRGAVESYHSSGQTIPWLKGAPTQPLADASEKWILVDV